MLFKPNASSGVPIYVQLVEQIRHAVEIGAMKPGEQLPSIRKVAEEIVINPNTVAKAYRELEREGWIETRQGAGAFVADQPRFRGRLERLREAQHVIGAVVEKLRCLGLDEAEMRRVFEAELLRQREGAGTRGGPRRKQ